jgi:hypothetical protein
MIDRMAKERALVEGSDGLLEGKTLVIALALSFGLDTVVAGWLPFVTLDTPPPTCLKIGNVSKVKVGVSVSRKLTEAAGLRSLSHISLL